MTKLFTFQAIETRYHGYRFRSRLEARWAVFFDTLGIEYQYEPEGYSLEGIPYLPDFYLPQMDCFIEIKGQEPTQEELGKTRLLALYTGKDVYTFSGNICFPDDPYQGSVYRYNAPLLIRRRCCEKDSQGEYIPTPPEVPLILQKLSEIDLGLSVERDVGGEKILVLKHHGLSRWKADEQEAFFLAARDQCCVMQQVFPLLKHYAKQIIEALLFHDGWENLFVRQHCTRDWKWCECSSCGELAISPRRKVPAHDYCSETSKGLMLADTPRLVAAYTAAREARF